MLDHLGESDAAGRILKALSEQSDTMTISTDPLSTTAVGDAIAERL
jgi:isocitrate/isopropylmalate dehydrogenase